MRRWLRSCASCGAIWGACELYCSVCWQSLLKQKKSGQLTGENFRVRYFWPWAKHSREIEAFVRHQKQRGLFEARLRLVKDCLSEETMMERPECLWFVRRWRETQSHGEEWARAFSCVLQRPCYPLFLNEETSPYKKKNRQERERERKVLAPYNPRYLQQKSWFIDDVYTTGATSRAVWVSLQKPKDFCVFTMVFKTYEKTTRASPRWG